MLLKIIITIVDFSYLLFFYFSIQIQSHTLTIIIIVKSNEGVRESGKVAIISNNRWEWATVAAAAYSINAAVTPMYEAQLPCDWQYILNDSGSSALFCATQEIYDQVQKEVLPSTPAVKACLCLDAPLGEQHSFHTALSHSEIDDSGSLIVAPTPEDLAGLIYTSGTTGKREFFDLFCSLHLN